MHNVVSFLSFIHLFCVQLEEQNQHLREQNEKCNEQLELLRSRLHQLSQVNANTKNNRGSTEVSTSPPNTQLWVIASVMDLVFYVKHSLVTS